MGSEILEAYGSQLKRKCLDQDIRNGPVPGFIPTPLYYVITTINKINNNFNNNEEISVTNQKYIKLSLIETELLLKNITGDNKIEIKKRGENIFGLTLHSLTAKTKALKCESVTLNGNTFEIKTELDAKLSHSKGSIYSRDMVDESDATLLEYMKDQKVIKIERILRKKEDKLVATGVFILTFDSPALPKRVNCSWERNVEVRPYFDNPMQCKNCWKYGHTTKRCKSAKLCSKCGANHEQTTCEQEMKCVNCQKNHSSNDRKCYIYQREKYIIETAARLKISFKDARLQLSEFEKSNGYANALRSNPNIDRRDEAKKTNSDSVKMIENKSEKSAQNRIEKIRNSAEETNDIAMKELPQTLTNATNVNQKSILNYFKPDKRNDQNDKQKIINSRRKAIDYILKMDAKKKAIIEERQSTGQPLHFRDVNGNIFDMNGKNIKSSKLSDNDKAKAILVIVHESNSKQK
jgi:hypothetical protein